MKPVYPLFSIAESKETSENTCEILCVHKILIYFVVKENLILNYRKQMKASEENCKKIQIKMRKTCKRLSSSLFTEITQADEVRTFKRLSSSLLTAIAQAQVVLLSQLGVGIFLTI